jgi:predicted RNA-binding Zn ribbon-like protein
MKQLVGGKLWLDFVNSDGLARGRGAPREPDALDTFDGFVGWLVAVHVLDDERAAAMLRRALQQPTGANAALHEARRMRNVLRALAERGDAPSERTTHTALAEINRVLGRSAGTRRVEQRPGGGFVRNFMTSGDVFAGLLTPVIESAADSLVAAELPRTRRCGGCGRVFYDGSRNGKRRWCEMRSCGNRAKAARHRKKERD